MLIAQTEAEELPTVSVNPYFTFGAVTKAVSEMKQHLNEFSNDEQVKVAKTGQFGAASQDLVVGSNRKILKCWVRYYFNPKLITIVNSFFFSFCSEQNDLLSTGRIQTQTVNKK